MLDNFYRTQTLMKNVLKQPQPEIEPLYKEGVFYKYNAKEMEFVEVKRPYDYHNALLIIMAIVTVFTIVAAMLS